MEQVLDQEARIIAAIDKIVANRNEWKAQAEAAMASLRESMEVSDGWKALAMQYKAEYQALLLGRQD